MGTFDGVITPGTNQDAVHVRLLELFGNDIGEVSAPLEMVMTWAVNYTQIWRGNQRAKMGLSSAQWQDLAYAGKAAHCRAWLADQSQPFGMAREAQVRGLTNVQMAELIVSQNDLWLDANDQIDAAYTAARAAIEAAQSVAEIEAVLAGLE